MLICRSCRPSSPSRTRVVWDWKEFDGRRCWWVSWWWRSPRRVSARPRLPWRRRTSVGCRPWCRRPASAATSPASHCPSSTAARCWSRPGTASRTWRAGARWALTHCFRSARRPRRSRPHCWLCSSTNTLHSDSSQWHWFHYSAHGATHPPLHLPPRLLPLYTYIHTGRGLQTNLYSAKNRENESEALAQDD